MTTTAPAIPVCLTPSSPLDIPPGALTFYDVIPSNVVSRCSVLAYAAEGEGNARLPDAVTLSDFKTWLTAVPWKSAQKGNIDFRSLCAIAKVADVLDDSRLGAWVDLLAERLLQLATGRDPGAHEAEVTSGLEAAEAMSALPHHVQGQVFAASEAVALRWYCSNNEERPAVHSLLDWMPQSMHATIAAATVTANKALAVNLMDWSRPLIDALAALPAAPPSVLSLTVECDMSQHDWAPQHLASVLRHHSGLTSFSLDALYTISEEFAALAPALATLSAMRTLRLGHDDNGITEDRLPSLKAALQGMPQLEHFALVMKLDDPSTGPLERQRDPSQVDGAAAPPWRCLCGTLAAATALTSLSLAIDHARQMQAGTCASDVTLPRLCSLSMEVDSCAWATSFFSHLTAPLTALTLKDMSDNSRHDNTDVRPFVSGLSKLTSLQQLRVSAAEFDTWADRALTTLLAGGSPELRPLQHLHSLEMDPCHQALQAAAPSLPSTFPALQTLTLTLYDDSQAPPHEWASTLSDICRLPVQHLRLLLADSHPHPSALAPLAALTAVKLSNASVRSLSTAAGVSALGRMSQLQRLHLGNFRSREFESYEQAAISWERLLPRLAALPGLTSLVIAEQQVPADALAATGGVPTAWPGLRRLGLALSCTRQEMKEVVSELTHAATALPCLEALVLGREQFSDTTLQETIEEAQGDGDTAMSVSEQLHQAARRAGFALTFNYLGRLWRT